MQRMASESRWPGAASSAAVVFPLESSPESLSKYQSWLHREPKYSGTNGAYMSLISDAADFIIVAREPSTGELSAARAAGIELEAIPVALDAFVFLVNTENPVASLTIDQLRGIYTDTGRSDLPVSTRIKNWQEVGGADRQIHAYTRNRNSGREELMEKLVMQGRKIITGGDRMLMSMVGTIEGVSRNPNSIAYSVYYYEHVMSPQAKNKLLAINGVQPTPDNIANRTYPLTAEFYVVTRKGIDRSTPAARLRDWLLTDEGQQLIAASGYVPVKSLATTNTAAASPQ